MLKSLKLFIKSFPARCLAFQFLSGLLSLGRVCLFSEILFGIFRVALLVICQGTLWFGTSLLFSGNSDILS